MVQEPAHGLATSCDEEHLHTMHTGLLGDHFMFGSRGPPKEEGNADAYIAPPIGQAANVACPCP